MTRTDRPITGGYREAMKPKSPAETHRNTGGACPDCVSAGLRAKASGFRDWRTGYACYEHAAVDLDGPWWTALMAKHGIADVAAGDQLDLFGSAA